MARQRARRKRIGSNGEAAWRQLSGNHGGEMSLSASAKISNNGVASGAAISNGGKASANRRGGNGISNKQRQQ
jgi:hypothetical protein